MQAGVAKHDQFPTPGGKIFRQFRKFRHEQGSFQLILFAGWGSVEAQDSKRLISVGHLGLTRFKRIIAVLLA